MAKRGGGFRPLGATPPGALGLPAKRSRELRLQTAWRRVAGEAVAARVPAVGVRRGVLELRRPDEAWRPTLDPLLPQLAARLAAMEPSLGIRRLRVRETHERGAPAVELPAPATDQNP